VALPGLLLELIKSLLGLKTSILKIKLSLALLVALADPGWHVVDLFIYLREKAAKHDLVRYAHPGFEDFEADPGQIVLS